MVTSLAVQTIWRIAGHFSSSATSALRAIPEDEAIGRKGLQGKTADAHDS